MILPDTLWKSTGVLLYEKPEEDYYRLVVLVDEELHKYLRSLVPDGMRCQKQKYEPHITVVRGEIPKNLDFWGKRNGQEIEFEYSSFLHHDGVYWWFNCYSPILTEIRLELGLPSSYHLTRPPDGTECFHSTVGNSK